MKKYILGTLLIAALVIVGGMKFFGNTDIAHAVTFCDPNSVTTTVSWTNGDGTSVCLTRTCNSTGSAYSSYSQGPCGGTIVGNTGGGNPPSTIFVCSIGSTVSASGNCYLCVGSGDPTVSGQWAQTACGSSALIGGAGKNTLSGNTPTLSWTPSSGATSYDLQIATDSNFSNVIVNKTGLTENTFKTQELQSNATYYWRVDAANAYGKSAYSRIFSFKTGAAAVGAKAQVISDGSVSEDIYSLIATLGKWTDKLGRMVNPKSITKAWVDENDQRVFPDVGPENAVKFIDALISARSGGSGNSGGRALPACGKGNYNTVSSGFTCCTDGWVWQYTGTAAQCSGATTAVGSVGNSDARALPACGVATGYNWTSGGFTCCTTGWVWLYTGSPSVCNGTVTAGGSSSPTPTH